MSAAEATAGVVLAFRPETTIVRNVEALLDQVPRVFVVDNDPNHPQSSHLEALRRDPRVVILNQPGNVGVAAGFNAGMRAALDAGFDFVWIFDQDTTVTAGCLSALHRAVAACTSVGIVGPALRSGTTGRIYAREQGVGARSTDVLISSGSLFAREVLDLVGLHDEPLFIDYVDHDISLRARAKGLVNLKVYDAIVDHHFGSAVPRRLFGRSVYLADYSPMRHFYSSRNRIVAMRRHGLGRWFWDDLWFTLKATVKMVLLERRRASKITAAFRGAYAGLRYPAKRLSW